jgi:CRISPR-associated endoribonuclease Cas6
VHPLTIPEHLALEPSGGMRLRFALDAPPAPVPWDRLAAGSRSALYALLAAGDPDLGAALHAGTWHGHLAGRVNPLMPAGAGLPRFPAAPRRKGAYMAGGPGTWETGTPLRRTAIALARGAASARELRWGAARFGVAGVTVLTAPAAESGTVRWRTATPVIARVRGGRFLLPGEPGWEDAVAANAALKADALGLPPAVTVELLDAGPKRSFVTSGTGTGSKTGATAAVRVTGCPALLRALWCWGLGAANSAGMGWIAC